MPLENQAVTAIASVLTWFLTAVTAFFARQSTAAAGRFTLDGRSFQPEFPKTHTHFCVWQSGTKSWPFDVKYALPRHPRGAAPPRRQLMAADQCQDGSRAAP